MKIRIIESFIPILAKLNKKTAFYLIPQKWNDYSYTTTYELYANQTIKEPLDSYLIGTVKIMRSGLKKQTYPLALDTEFEKLDEHFCSIGQSAEYYKNLNRISPLYKNTLLEALRDIVAYPELTALYDDEDVFCLSLMRDFHENKQLLNEINHLYQQGKP